MIMPKTYRLGYPSQAHLNQKQQKGTMPTKVVPKSIEASHCIEIEPELWSRLDQLRVNMGGNKDYIAVITNQMVDQGLQRIALGLTAPERVS